MYPKGASPVVATAPGIGYGVVGTLVSGPQVHPWPVSPVPGLFPCTLPCTFSGSPSRNAAGLKASAFVRSQLGLGINVDAQNDHHDGGGQDAGPPAPTPELPSASAFPKGCCQTCGVPQVLRRRVKGITVCSTCEWTASGADRPLPAPAEDVTPAGTSRLGWSRELTNWTTPERLGSLSP